MNISTKQKHTQRHREQAWLPRGRWGEKGLDWEFGVGGCKLLHLEWISSKVLLQAQGTIFNIL